MREDTKSNPTAVIRAALIGAAGVVVAALVHGAFGIAIQRHELRTAEINLEMARLQARSTVTSTTVVTRPQAVPRSRATVKPNSRVAGTTSTPEPIERKGPGYNRHHGGGA